MKLTKPQQHSLKRVWEQHHERYREPHTSYLSMRRQVTIYPDNSGCVGIMVGLMYVGIETDGYTHT
jgi:hypothetical protein